MSCRDPHRAAWQCQAVLGAARIHGKPLWAQVPAAGASMIAGRAIGTDSWHQLPTAANTDNGKQRRHWVAMVARAIFCQFCLRGDHAWFLEEISTAEDGGQGGR